MDNRKKGADSLCQLFVDIKNNYECSGNWESESLITRMARIKNSEIL